MLWLTLVWSKKNEKRNQFLDFPVAGRCCRAADLTVMVLYPRSQFSIPLILLFCQKNLRDLRGRRATPGSQRAVARFRSIGTASAASHCLAGRSLRYGFALLLRHRPQRAAVPLAGRSLYYGFAALVAQWHAARRRTCRATARSATADHPLNPSTNVASLNFYRKNWRRAAFLASLSS